MKPKAVSPAKKGAKPAEQSLDSKSVGVSKSSGSRLNAIVPMSVAEGSSSGLFKRYAPNAIVPKPIAEGGSRSLFMRCAPNENTPSFQKRSLTKKPENVMSNDNDDNKPSTSGLSKRCAPNTTTLQLKPIMVPKDSPLTPMEKAIIMRHLANLHSTVTSILEGTYHEKKTLARKPENVKPKANDDDDNIPSTSSGLSNRCASNTTTPRLQLRPIMIPKDNPLTPMEKATIKIYLAKLQKTLTSILSGTKKKETLAKKPENAKPNANDDDKPSCSGLSNRCDPIILL